MENNTLFQLFKDHFDAIAIVLTAFIGYFQVRSMMREEVKHITDPIREMLAAHNSRMEKIESRIDANIVDGNRKWEANELRWAEMRKESHQLMKKIHCIELDQAKK